MTIQEAIKSGKPFRRPQHSEYVQFLHVPGPIRLSSLEDLLATDWETKPEPMIVYINTYEDEPGSLFLHRSRLSAEAIGDFRPGKVTRKFVEVIE